MPKDLLSDAKIRTAKPAANRYKLGDGGGLFLSVEKTGSKLWRWKFRLDGKENLFAIGSYPEVSLAEARAARDAARELVKQGINPSQHRKDERQRNIKAAAARKHAEALAQELSFAKVSAAYLAKVKPDYTPGSYRSKESRIRKYLSPKLDTLPITEIGPKEIRPILEVHIPADHEHRFRFNVNTISGPM
ncbi:integrase arm-type DNA-binding domain-containing protein [Aeromonas sp. ASNIH1]|uniref:integrase arm-type DNA-binding domain-containing protein n=1 Tax=Aeromonas sp. ASNIH1 TaxID=1636606 RepID=UPI0018F837BD|nr:integrase arm-type DNA-binding domain-containing protein [Aeromonas sp. ASNIH1]